MGGSVPLCCRHGFLEASYFLWKLTFGEVTVSGAKRLKQLEAENASLKNLLAVTLLEAQISKEALRREWWLPVLSKK